MTYSACRKHWTSNESQLNIFHRNGSNKITAKEILSMNIRTLTSLLVKSCSVQLAYWTEAVTIFNYLNNKTE